MRKILRIATLISATVLTLAACGSNNEEPKAPSAPSGVTAQAGSATSVHVMWNQAPAKAGISGYTVYRGGAKVKDVPATRNMTDVTGLKPSTAYTFTVRARDTDGTLSPHSTGTPVTTPGTVTEDKKAPARPTGLTGKSDGARAALLNWGKAAGDQGITSYDIHQGVPRSIASMATRPPHASPGCGRVPATASRSPPGTPRTTSHRPAAPSRSPPRTAPATIPTPHRPRSGPRRTPPTARTTSICPGWRRRPAPGSPPIRSISTERSRPHWPGAASLPVGAPPTASRSARAAGPTG